MTLIETVKPVERRLFYRKIGVHERLWAFHSLSPHIISRVLILVGRRWRLMTNR